MKKIIENQSFDEERALYAVKEVTVRNCHFGGPVDGESSLKETKDIEVLGCSFSQRYSFWHVSGFKIDNITMDEATRAAMWYDDNGTISNSKLHGIKVIRECHHIAMKDCDIDSEEFAWRSSGLTLENCNVHSVYPFLFSSDINIKNMKMTGKYSFQYTENVVIDGAYIETKDCLWHSKDVTIKNATIKGEYLAWYSEGLTLINCKIIGTQPLCYCKRLKLIDCELEECYLGFEYSDVEADIKGHIDSVKNPLHGYVKADSIGEVIRTGAVYDCDAKVFLKDGTEP